MPILDLLWFAKVTMMVTMMVTIMVWSVSDLVKEVLFEVCEVHGDGGGGGGGGGVLATDHHRYSAIGWLVYTTIYIR